MESHAGRALTDPSVRYAIYQPKEVVIQVSLYFQSYFVFLL